MIKYAIAQKRLSFEIDKTFHSNKMALRIIHYQGTKGYLNGITIASADPYPYDVDAYGRVANRIMDDIKRFQIMSPAAYAKATLVRNGIHGFAICAKQEEYDPGFGEFVAKARLLKHLNALGMIKLPDKCEYFKNGQCDHRMRWRFICDKCNHGACTLIIEDNEDGELDTPEQCPFDQFQPTNWRKK